jgi:hypothetical protein
MLSDISYHGYVAMISLLDSAWSREWLPGIGSTDFIHRYISAQDNLRKKCDEYSNKIQKNYNRYQEANRRFESTLANGVSAAQNESLDCYLYKPLFYLPFGHHADIIAITILDDFDAFQHLTVIGDQCTVERIEMGFCPTCDSLKFVQEKSAEQEESIFCDLRDLLSKDCQKINLPTEDDKVKGTPHYFFQHPFQEKLPLLVYSKCKFAWLGTVGYALFFEQALLKAIARKIRNIRGKLREQVLNQPNWELMDLNDVDSVRCAVIDLQSEEELGLLFFCSNYSVGISFTYALRSLTLNDLFKEDERLKHALQQSREYQQIIKLKAALENNTSPEAPEDLQGNTHVFRWTNTILAVSPVAMFTPEKAAFKGYIDAVSHFQVAAGHEMDTEKQVIHTTEHKQEAKFNLVDVYRYQVGIADMAFPLTTSNAKMKEYRPPFIQLKDAISIIGRNLRKFSGKQSLRAEEEDHCGGVIDFTTVMHVPIPRFLGSGIEDSYNTLLQKVLPYLQLATCFHNKNNSQSLKAGPHMGRLDLSLLEISLERCGFPVELQRTILQLYKDYAHYLKDPLIFDSILDLYDAFATLHATLTKHLPKTRSRQLIRKPDDWLELLDKERIDDTASLVRSIHDALTHRISKMYPESPIRDLAIDFREGFYQIILAANAPLLCSLSLLRKYVIGAGLPPEVPRNCVGGIANISLTPGIRASRFNLGIKRFTQLGVIEADVPHFLYPPCYTDYLHECSHLIYYSLGVQNMLGLGLSSIPKRSLANRVEEIFADLLTYLILFAGDYKAFLYHQVFSFSELRSSLTTNEKEIITQFSNLLVEAFIVVDAVKPDSERKDWLNTSWHRSGARKREVRQKFKKMLEKITPLLPDPFQSGLWDGEKSRGWRQCLRTFNRVYPQVQVYMWAIWEHAIQVFRKYYQKELKCNENSPDRQKEIYPIIDQAFLEGRPLIRCLYPLNSAENKNSDTDADGFNPLALGCAMLCRYITRLENATDKEVHLRRNFENGEILYSSAKRPWFSFQVERGVAAMFTPVPSERSNRLKREIVILKTFWDIAANLRARRLHEIVSDVWDGAKP